MIGHPEPPYRYFGRAAARLDDAASFLPARVTALAIVAAARLLGADAEKRGGSGTATGVSMRAPTPDKAKPRWPALWECGWAARIRMTAFPHTAPLLCAEGRAPSVGDARAAVSVVALVSGIAFGAALLVVSWGEENDDPRRRRLAGC